ncbi:MAG: hypothetical protein ABI670_16920 [Chloroflexota bacterium]
MASTHATGAVAGRPAVDRTISFGRLPLRVFLYWLPSAFAITVLAGLLYGAVQQSFRQTANDPQIQMAEDAAAQLESGQGALAVVGAAKVDMARSLAPFLIVYDDAGNVLASSVQLNGATPDLPAGVFTSVLQGGEDRLSWQPQEGVRSATVVARYGGSKPGFVLAGRSLREVEKREDQLRLFAGIAWLGGIVGSLVLWAFALAVIDRVTRSTTRE